MKEWPTYQLTLKDFCKAWPGSKVFVNDYSTKGLKPTFSENPVVYLYDLMMDTIFAQSIIYQKTNESWSPTSGLFPFVVFCFVWGRVLGKNC